MKVKVSGGQFFADGFALRSGFEMEEGDGRLISYLSDHGCGAARLTFQEGSLRVSEGQIGLILWKEGAELFPLPDQARFPTRTERTFPIEGGEINVRCLSGALPEITLSGWVTANIPAAFSFRRPEISLIGGQRVAILQIRAEAEAGEYLLMLSVGKEGATKLLETCGESVLCEGNEVRTTRTLDDLLGRRLSLRYLWRGDHFESSREITCANAHPFIRELSGRALLEAVYAGDEKEILSLVSAEIGDTSSLIDYFGEIVSVRPDPFSESPTAFGAVKREASRLAGITYDFEIDREGKIENITSNE